MGPLVPDVIGNELNFIVALFVGVAFGFILEQAGFSTSKKLVGLFYGYDFTVLRVFFTAGLVAMMGVIAFDHWGLIDMNLVYINPTFLWSALVGGMIMGLGFVVGGFCPGTSVCAAAIGKIDAMIFIVGSFFGVLIFAEGYPLFENLYKAAPWGNVRIFNSLGMSQSLFAFLLTAGALGAFWITTLIENKINGKPNPEFSSKRLYIGLTGVALIFALSAFAMPEKRQALLAEAADAAFVQNYQAESMDCDELAFSLIDKDKNLELIDLRPKKEFDSLMLPNSIHMELENLFDKSAHNLLTVKHKRYLFLGENEIDGKKGAVLARELGYNQVFYLKGGLQTFRKNILNFSAPNVPEGVKISDTDRFRSEAVVELPQLIKEYKAKMSSAGATQAKPKRVIGGC